MKSCWRVLVWNLRPRGTAGDFDRVINLTLSGGLQAGDALLLRWFPTLTTNAATPGSGTSYGQFRTDAVVDGSDIAWVTPGDGATDALNFATASQGGSQPDGAGTASETTPGGGPAETTPQITGATSAEAVVGQAFRYQIDASHTPTLYKANGLPPGLTVAGDSGLISGTPTQAGDFSIALEASNAAGTGNATLMLTVQAPPAIQFPKITSANTADGVAGQSFAYQIVATENPASFGATGLPSALAIDATTGLISGVISPAGVFHISLSARNADGTGTAALALTVTGAAPPPPPVVLAPAITSILSVNAETGLPFRYQITASNQPSSFGANPLPVGFSVNPATGLVAGTPTAAGEYAIVVSAVNAAGQNAATLQLKVSAPSAAHCDRHGFRSSGNDWPQSGWPVYRPNFQDLGPAADRVLRAERERGRWS